MRERENRTRFDIFIRLGKMGSLLHTYLLPIFLIVLIHKIKINE